MYENEINEKKGYLLYLRAIHKPPSTVSKVNKWFEVFRTLNLLCVRARAYFCNNMAENKKKLFSGRRKIFTRG